jgi:predicted ATPase/DNA-binding CsgD family transcriptional regulator
VTENSRTRVDLPPLFGRDDESAILAATLDEAGRGRGACIFIEGPAGIGKSRLAREAAALAHARGFLTLVGACSQEERGTAYAPIIDATRDRPGAAGASTEAAARRLRDALAGSRSAGDKQDASTAAQQEHQARVTDAMLELLRQASLGAGSLLVLEDMHWADHGTTRLVRQIARHVHDLRCALLLTYRDDEVADHDALVDLIHVLNSSELNVRTMHLRALTWAETRAMARSVLDIAWMPATAFVDQLYARAEGNPFFTEEILRALPVDAKTTRLDLRIPDQLPLSVTRLLQQRIRRLPAKVVRMLATAAVLGRRFDEATLLSVGDLAKPPLLDALRRAVDAHLIRDIGDGRTFEFQHALIREAAEGMLLSSERVSLHQRVAEEMAAPGGSSSDSAQIAYHYARAGTLAQHRHYAVAAADAAWRAGAPTEAARWYERVLTAGEQGEEESEPVLLRAAEAFAAARFTRLATDTFERVIERQRARGDALAEGETLAEFATLFTADFARWTELLQRALHILEPLGETVALARVYGRLASLYVLTSQAREAIEAGRMARDIAKRTRAPDAEAVGRRALGIIVAAGGDLDAGRRFLERSIELAKSVNKHTDVYLSSLGLIDAAIRASDWVLAEATARDSIDYALKLGSGSEAGSLTARLADLLRFTGRVEEAHVTIEKALLLLDQDEVYLFSAALLVKADILADLGQWRDVRDVVTTMLPAAELSRQFHIYGGALFLLARAASGEGRIVEARQLVDRALAEWRLSQDNYYCLPMLLFACRLACDAGDLPAARGFVVELQGVFARTPLCTATIPAAGAYVAAAEKRMEDAILLWRESVAGFAGLGRPIDASRARLELGRALLAGRSAEDRDEARTQLLAVQAAAAGLPEAGHAEALLKRHRLVAVVRGHGPLTEREWEVVLLIARGLTNRRIATELTLSARTVDNHVSRILSKLQLASRSQIVAYAMERGVTGARSVK